MEKKLVYHKPVLTEQLLSMRKPHLDRVKTDKLKNKKCSICGEKPCIKGLCRKCYMKEYCKRPEIKTQIKERMKKYRQIPEIKEHRKEYGKEYNRKNPERNKAYKKLHFAVKSGIIIKPNCCTVCGANEYICGHHEDYTRPLDVIWTCTPCHKEFLHSK